MGALLDLIESKILASLISDQKGVERKVLNYLKAFGYLTGIADDISDIVARIQQAQAVLNVPATGVIDDVTIKAMEMTPRCGHPDYQAASGSLNMWLKSKAQNGLTYHIVRYVNGLTTQEQEDAIARSFTAWEKVSRLRTYRKNSTDADIIIDASASRNEEFGTAGNVLAWAYLPQGDAWTGQLIMKYDLAERWVLTTSGNGFEILIETVTKHECGHLWGLDHTQTKGQLMYPIYDPLITGPQKGYDIDQIVARYDAPETVPPADNPFDGNPFDGTVITRNGKFYKIVPQ